MKQSIPFVILATIICLSCTPKKTQRDDFPPNGKGLALADSAGIKLAIQSFTFHKFSLVETFEKVKELDIKFLEVYPGHKLGGEWGDKAFGPHLSTQEQEEIKALAKKYNIKIVACGVYGADNEEDWNKFFDFAKNMKLEYVTCDPQYEHLDHVEKLAQETGIKVGIHNHPQPSNYWNVDLLLEKIKDRSNAIGACADVGHWNREGLDQVECLEKLNGKVISLHFKDLSPKKIGSNEQRDIIWGDGVLDIEAMLLELKNQHFKGYLAIEYEANWDNSVPDIKACIEYYDLASYIVFKALNKDNYYNL